MPNWEKIAFTPYGFTDIGQTWNDATGQPARETGASAGFGMRAVADIGLSGNLGLAWPLIRPIAVPIYGFSTPQGPRLLLQVMQSF